MQPLEVVTKMLATKLSTGRYSAKPMKLRPIIREFPPRLASDTIYPCTLAAAIRRRSFRRKRSGAVTAALYSTRSALTLPMPGLFLGTDVFPTDPAQLSPPASRPEIEQHRTWLPLIALWINRVPLWSSASLQLTGLSLCAPRDHGVGSTPFALVIARVTAAKPPKKRMAAG